MKLNEQEYNYFCQNIISHYENQLIDITLSGNENKLDYILEELFSNGDKDETIKGFLTYITNGNKNILPQFHNSYIEQHYRTRQFIRCLDEGEPEVTRRTLRNLLFELKDFIKNY